jgi:hypothetical protein
MKEPKAYEKYPISTIIIYYIISLTNCAVGIYLLYLINPILAGLYVIYLIGLELSVYKEGCVSCYYYGKRCFSGRGKVVPLLFKREDPKKFCEKQITWKNLLPMILVSVVPLVSGVYLLLQSFSWLILAIALVPIFIWFVGNPLIYGKLGCPHCKQERICCPANDFFGKKVKKKKSAKTQ